MDFLIFETFTIFPVFKSLLWNFLSCSAEHGILGYTSLQFLELLFNFVTFSLLFIKLGLKLRGHFVVTILSFFQIDSNLMNISESVEIFMLVHLNVWLFIILFEGGVNSNNLFLKLFIFSS